MVEYRRSHTNQAFVLDLRPMYIRIVADRHIVAYFGHRTLVKRMDHRPVLNVNPVADSNFIDVAPYHGAEPDAAIAPDRRIADHRGVIRQKGILSNYRGESPDRFNDCHNYSVFSFALFLASHHQFSISASESSRSDNPCFSACSSI